MSKPRFLPVFVVCSLLTACASIDKGDAAKLAEEGKATTQEVVRKNDLVAESFITKTNGNWFSGNSGALITRTKLSVFLIVPIPLMRKYLLSFRSQRQVILRY